MMKEFKKQGLDVVYKDEIEEWKKYKRGKIFSKKVEEQMLEEIDRFINSR